MTDLRPPTPSMVRLLGSITGERLAYLALGSMVCSCTPPPKARPYPDPTFNPTAWQQDSVGCLAYRARTYESLAARASFFSGQPAAFLQCFLGRPSFCSTHYAGTGALYYVVSCTEIPIPKAELRQGKLPGSTPRYDPEQATTLVFDMDQGKCLGVRIAIP
ncbi:MAG: hypothetical protein EOO60_01780 [Hymenobacter sp.]|nr:MAG: hypothetical protein EOO60_01780 [Hymenobacter sp.]